MLWATGVQETDGNGYFVDQNATPGAGNTQVWPAPVFQQGPVIVDPIILTFPYPYLAPDATYGGTCGGYLIFLGQNQLMRFTSATYPGNNSSVKGDLAIQGVTVRGVITF